MGNTLCSTDTYSVVIRTIGKGGENYKRLLESIKKQTLQPEHIFVVLPYDYALPPEQISTEEFVFTDKGMWNQRIFGLKYADTHSNSRYYLVVDDDVEFGKDFVRKAMARMTENDIALLAPQSVKPDWQVPSPVKRFSLSNICNVLLGRRFESRRPNIRTHIAATGGFFKIPLMLKILYLPNRATFRRSLCDVKSQKISISTMNHGLTIQDMHSPMIWFSFIRLISTDTRQCMTVVFISYILEK